MKKKVMQVEYMGRWVSKEHFRVWVYGLDKTRKLADSYKEYIDLLATGQWFTTPEEAVVRVPAKETIPNVAPEVEKSGEQKAEKVAKPKYKVVKHDANSQGIRE